MRVYSVYRHPLKGYKAIKQGFSWTGFLFGFWWALFKQLWFISFILFVVFVVITIIENYAEASGSASGVIISLLMLLGFAIYVGVSGNDWVTDNLNRSGFEFTGLTPAGTKSEAIGLNRVAGSAAKQQQGKGFGVGAE